MKHDNKQLLAAFAALAAGFAWAAPSGVFAQQRTAPPTEEITLPPRPAAITPRLSVRQPPGIQTAKTAGPVDWAAVKVAVDETRERDAAFDRELRAMTLSRVISPEEQQRRRPKGVRAMAPEQTERVSAQEVRRTRLPLLAPVTADTINNLRVTARENAFTAFGDLPNGASFELLGTRMRVVGGTDELMKSRAAQRSSAVSRLDGIDAPFLISRHEEGVDLSFSKFNAAYLLTVYCPDPDADARCADDGYVRSLAENLAIFNEDEGATP